MTNILELTDGVVMLKPFSMEDAEEHLHGEDIEMEKWLSGGKSTIESVRNYIRHSQESWEKDGLIFTFAIRTTKDGKLIGQVEINTDWKSIDGIEDGDANIAYGLYPEARGKGYMVRAINLTQGFLKTKGIKRSVIRVNPQNTNSLRVPIKCGYTKTGRTVIEKGNMLVVFVKEL